MPASQQQSAGRDANGDLLSAVVTDCETAMRDHDLGRSIVLCKGLAFWASECEFSNVQHFTRPAPFGSSWLALPI